MERLVLGQGHTALGSGRLRTIQAPGGCGALRFGAELIRAAAPDAVVHVSTPTWANHVPLLSNCGLRLERYPYFDPATGGVAFDAMLDSPRSPAAALGGAAARLVSQPDGRGPRRGPVARAVGVGTPTLAAAFHRHRLPGPRQGSGGGCLRAAAFLRGAARGAGRGFVLEEFRPLSRAHRRAALAERDAGRGGRGDQSAHADRARPLLHAAGPRRRHRARHPD